MLILGCCVEDYSWSHGRVHIEIIKDLPMARCVDPREVKRGLDFLSILTDALQKSNSLALTFFFVIDLKLLGFLFTYTGDSW